MIFLYAKELKSIKETLSNKGLSGNFSSASKEDIAYLEEIHVPDSIRNFFEHAEPSEIIEIGDARLAPVSYLQEENNDAVPGYIIFPLGFRIVGSTTCGDAFCVNINPNDSNEEPAVYLASHDEIYEDMTPEEILPKIVKVADTFRDFLLKFGKGSLPKDYYDIEDSNED